MRLFWFQIACTCATFSSSVMRASRSADPLIHRSGGVAIHSALLTGNVGYGQQDGEAARDDGTTA